MNSLLRGDSMVAQVDQLDELAIPAYSAREAAY